MLLETSLRSFLCFLVVASIELFSSPAWFPFPPVALYFPCPTLPLWGAVGEGSSLDLTPNASMFPGVTYAAKGYFDALVRMGEMASESQGSKDLGESL